MITNHFLALPNTLRVPLVGSLLLAVNTALAAQLLPDKFQIQDRGQARVFEVASDELHVVTPIGKHQRQTILPQPDIATLRQQASALGKNSGSEVDLVLYESGAAHTDANRRILTRQVLVELEANQNPATLAQSVGANGWSRTSAATNLLILETSEVGGAIALAQALRAQTGVLSAEPLLAKQQQKRFLPNDTLFPNQWHLRNTGQGGGTAGMDVNITNVWNTYKGTGIRLAIVDDGLQRTHPDLQPNYDSTISTNFNDHTADPSPNVADDYHGTSCAGVAAARATNSLGGAGAAFLANLGGLRLIGGATTDADEAAAMSYRNDVIHLKSNSWGPADDGSTLEGPGPLTLAALAQGAQTGRGGKGVIYVWAGGNGRENLDNANYDGYANSIYTIAIGAMSDQGNQASYSESGACLVVCAPSSSSGRQEITTTDLLGEDGYNYTGASGELADKNYTQTFGGTSSATPLAAGVIGLMLQANPNLGWRDVQEILMRSATKNAPGDSDWFTNSAGFKFNHKFGAGLINAGAAITLATNWTNLGAQSNLFSAQTGLSVAIPDGNATGITRSFVITNVNFRVEQVTVITTINHTYRGDLAITLTSPSGTQSVLAEEHDDFGDNYTNWKFMSVRDWGETPAGTWTVKIADLAAVGTGTLTAIRLDIFGTVPPAQISADLAVTSSNAPNPIVAGESLTYTVVVQNNGPTNATSVMLTDVLPADVNFISASASQGSVTKFGNNLIGNFGALNPNASATITFTVVPNQGGSLTNVASVTAAEADSNPGNNGVTTISAVTPQIFNTNVQARLTSAIIYWDTHTNSPGQIEYGFTTNYGFLSPFNPALATNHAALLVGLLPATNYFYRIIAQVGTNILRAGPFSFSTDLSVIVDNPQASYSGSWVLGTSAADKYGTYYHSSATTLNASPTAQATYTPNLPLTAKYDVYIWYPAGVNRSTNAQVTIVNNSGSVLRSVNQTTNGGGWRLLVAGLDFTASTSGFATIGNNTGESGKIVMADALRWSYSQAQDNPGDGSVPDWWFTYYFGAPVNTTLDPDGDGLSTYAEYIIGTDPTNATSQLQMSVSPVPTGMNVLFTPAQGGRFYQLATTTNLSSGAWSFLPDAPSINTSTGMFSIPFPNPPGNRFYRLSVQLAQ